MVAFYKHDIPSWMDGTENLSDGAYRAYHTICQLIYLHEGPITLNEKGIAGRCNQRRDRFRLYLAELVAAGKLTVVEGRVHNGRAEAELDSINERRRGRAGAHNGSVGARNGIKTPDKPLKPKEPPKTENGQNAKTRQDNTPPTPPPGGEGEGVQKVEGGESHATGIAHFAAEDLGNTALWESFKNAWPIGSDANEQTQAIFSALDLQTQGEAIAGVFGYVREIRAAERKLCGARRYLTEKRWKGLKPASSKDSGPKIPGVVIFPGSEEWERWDAFLEQAGVYQGVSYSQIKQNNEYSRPFRVPSQWPPENAT